MKSLILETSTDSSLIAVIDGDILVFEKHLMGGPQLSKSLGQEIKKILEISPPPFDRIVIGIGPGSYTGIRVGAAMAQALAFGWNIPLYSASSTSAFGLKNQENFIIAIDARSGGFFIQENFNKPKLIKLEEAEPRLRAATCIATPHPERINSRISGLSNVVKTEPNPFLLAQFSTPSEHLDLTYLSSPG
jgi:tRNA threonylcarbamoyladenosine biosynthesis protein TsaB